jgi:ribosomal protein L31
LHLTRHIAKNVTFVSCSQVATNIESNTPISCREVTTYIENDTFNFCCEVATDIANKHPFYEGLTTMVPVEFDVDPMDSRTSTDVVPCMLGL